MATIEIVERPCASGCDWLTTVHGVRAWGDGGYNGPVESHKIGGDFRAGSALWRALWHVLGQDEPTTVTCVTVTRHKSRKGESWTREQVADALHPECAGLRVWMFDKLMAVCEL